MIMIAKFPLTLAVFFNSLLTNFIQQLLTLKITIVTIIPMKFGKNLSDLNFQYEFIKNLYQSNSFAQNFNDDLTYLTLIPKIYLKNNFHAKF